MVKRRGSGEKRADKEGLRQRMELLWSNPHPGGYLRRGELEVPAQAGANACGVSDCYGPLVTAAEKGLTEAIKCLVEAGANPNVFDMFGRLPIELAAEYGTREDVEILFPFTSPVSTVANWSVDGIISHVKMETKQLEDDNFVKKRMSELKLQADEAFKKQDYINASVLYTQKRSPAAW